MSPKSFLRRATVPAVVAAAATAAVVAAAAPAGAIFRPGLTVQTYQLNAAESWNACGGSAAVLHFYDESATMTVDCATGAVTIYSVS